ncbi:MAG: GNAT family N-acetyltransferase [Pirellulales bacterium]|nr:GNAT family N-acetyltransferase [Pirellulales bacterium]
MIDYRSFINTDPPRLAELWTKCAAARAHFQRVTPELLDDLVFSKQYFDRKGLIVATEDSVPVGFVHAAFGPSKDFSTISSDVGVICALLVDDSHRGQGVGRSLLALAQQFLLERGAKLIYGGGARPFNPFYWGLYGGAEFPGVLASEPAAQGLFQSAGFEVFGRTVLWRCDLDQFKPPMNRQQLQVKRQFDVRAIADPQPATWWEANTAEALEQVRYELVCKTTRDVKASVTLWTMERKTEGMLIRSAGVMDLLVDEDLRRQGAGTFLVGDALRELKLRNFATVEGQTFRQDEGIGKLLSNLGFQEVDQGTIFRKVVNDATTMPLASS